MYRRGTCIPNQSRLNKVDTTNLSRPNRRIKSAIGYVSDTKINIKAQEKTVKSRSRYFIPSIFRFRNNNRVGIMY